MSGPQTSAGRGFLAQLSLRDTSFADDYILAIEQEATAAALARVRAAVEGLPDFPMDHGKYVIDGAVDRVTVLALLGDEKPEPTRAYDYETEGFGGT